MTGTSTAAKRYPGRALFSVLFMTVMGPVVGGLLILIGLWLSSDGNLSDLTTNWETILQIASFVGLYSYILGIIQAAAAGLVVAFYVYFQGRVSTLISILASLFGTLVFAALYTVIIQQDVPQESTSAFILDSNVLGLVIFLGILGIAAGLICRALLGLFFKAPQPALAPA